MQDSGLLHALIVRSLGFGDLDKTDVRAKCFCLNLDLHQKETKEG